MKQQTCRILQNEQIAAKIFRMVLSADTKEISRPGQFINIALPGLFLRRPISICDWDAESITIIYKVVGQGTDVMSALAAGDELDVLLSLGNGFDISKSGAAPLIIGGGVGVPPLCGLARQLKEEGKQPSAILGFGSAQDIICLDFFRNLGIEVRLLTADGSAGEKGFVTAAMPDFEQCSYFYSCGPLPMLKAVCEQAVIQGEISLEERMGCGFGACMGCSVQTKSGFKRVCKEGPVLLKEEMIW